MKQLRFDLEVAKSNLDEDIQSLTYLLEEYFEQNENIEVFSVQRPEIFNNLIQLQKSMLYNSLIMERALQNTITTKE